MKRARPSRASGALAAALLCLVAACTSNATTIHGTAEAAPTTPTSPTASSTTSGTPADTSTTAPGTQTASAGPSTSIAAPVPPTPKDACSTSQLTVRALRGSGAQQQEFALLTFTNSSQVPCSLYGFPGVSLRLDGAPLGAPAGRSAASPVTVRLAPGAQAQSMLIDNSSCQAPLSDTVRVYPPNTTAFVDRPMQIRGCALVVAPVTLS